MLWHTLRNISSFRNMSSFAGWGVWFKRAQQCVKREVPLLALGNVPVAGAVQKKGAVTERVEGTDDDQLREVLSLTQVLMGIAVYRAHVLVAGLS